MRKKLKDIDDPRRFIFKALSCGRRIYMLELLKNKEMSGSDLIPVLGIDQSAISRHLSILKQAGLLKSFKKGVNVYYKVEDPAVFDMLEVASSILKKKEKKLLSKLR